MLEIRMHKTPRRSGKTAIGLVLLLLLHSPATGQVLRYIETSKPEVLNPVEGYKDVIGVRIIELLFRGLLSQDRNGVWEPEMASSLPVFQQGTTEIIAQLRDGLKWPDDHALTAGDVVFSYQVYMDPANRYGNRNIFEVFSEVEALGPSQVKFHLAHSSAASLRRLGFPLMPQHLLKNTYLDPNKGYSRQPMGSGPFAVTEADDNLLVFGLNKNYPGKQPSIEGIELEIGPDQIHTHQLLTGRVQLDPVVRPQDMPQVTSSAYTDVRGYDSNEWSGFAYNTSHPVLKLKEVRQALTFLFDRAAALRANFGEDAGVIISGPFTPSSFCINPEVRPRSHDPIMADRLLDQANLLDRDGNGFREYKGSEVRLRMVLSKSMSEANKAVCADFQRQAAEHMIRVDLDYQEKEVRYERVFYRHDYEIAFVTWKFDAASNVHPLFSVTQQEPGSYNIVQFNHDGVEELLGRFRHSTDDAERTAAGQRLHAVLHEEVPYTFLWTLHHYAGLRIDKIKRIQIDPFYFFRTIENWEMAAQ
jgi:peptide/nickel transport system substrate-binding protein